MENVVEIKSCLHCETQFEITQSDLDFYNKISPTFAGEKFMIPAPTLCPDCRQRRRLSFRNERKLYKRKCNASGKDIISIYHPESDYIVYDQKIRWSDEWDPMDYGRNFDFTKSFTEQFGELMRVVPRMSAGTFNSENSNFTNFCMNSKDCYMVFSCVDSQGCMYGRNIRRCNNVIDCLQIVDSSYCYGIIIAGFCTNVKWGYHIFHCSDSEFLWYCENCHFCFACSNLKNAKYCIFNKQYSKEEYFMEIERIRVNQDPVNLVYEMNENKYNYINRGFHLINNEGLCGYEFIRNSKDVLCSYNISDSSHIQYGMELERCNDCFDCNFGIGNELLYEGIALGVGMSRSAFYITGTNGFGIYYCDHCLYCSNCFGCIGLRNKSYCIFNKQYTKEEYEIMVGKIIRHMCRATNALGVQISPDPLSFRERETQWGEFFHPSLSPFGYNETVAQEYYPIDDTMLLSHYDTKLLSSEVTKLETTNLVTSQPRNLATFGYHRSNYIAPSPQVDKVIKGSHLPDTIEEVTDDILKMAVLCEISNKLFRITPQELAFYRKHDIPLPKKHPDIRHEERMELRY